MTTKELIPLLKDRLSNMEPQIETLPTLVTYRGAKRSSEWSRQIKIPNDETPCNYLKKVFGINCSDWEDKYNQAVKGNGNEAGKIMTLHSSSLLALLCFSNISSSNTLKIGGKKYDQVRFEVKNRVFGNPSNIDVVLQNNQTGDLLFLESKFTEYLTPDNSAFSVKYFEFYNNILPKIEGFPLQMVFPRKYDKGKPGMGLQPTSKSVLYSHLYMDGIKQSFSHLIGICQGPDKTELFKWENCKGSIKFGNILYKFPGDSFNSYKNFYSKTIGKIDSDKFNEAIECTDGIDNCYTKRIEILHDILTYQDVFKDFNLPKNVKSYYNFPDAK